MPLMAMQIMPRDNCTIYLAGQFSGQVSIEFLGREFLPGHFIHSHQILFAFSQNGSFDCRRAVYQASTLPSPHQERRCKTKKAVQLLSDLRHLDHTEVQYRL
jgi:hypothetical protein